MKGNTNYKRGRAKEYRVKKKYEKNGWIVIRSAGSHSFADLICISREGKVIKFIQCKPNKYSKIKRAMLEKEYNWLNNEFIVKFEVE